MMYKFDNDYYETYNGKFPMYCQWDNFLNDNELDTIVNYCEKFDKKPAKTFNDFNKMRKTNIVWITPNNESSWFIERIHWAIKTINEGFYNFDLTHFEDFQYTCYDEIGSKYDYHYDCEFNTKSNILRKLSCVLLLSDVDDFTGGQLQLLTDDEKGNLDVELTRGRLVVFPSFIPHRVTDIQSGIRKTLVNWVSGPHFR